MPLTRRPTTIPRPDVAGPGTGGGGGRLFPRRGTATFARRVHFNLGEVRRRRDRADEAAACYRRAIQARGDYPEAHNGLGMALDDMGQSLEAIAAFERGLELRPDFVDALLNLAAAWLHRGGSDEALARCREAGRLAPDYAAAHNNLGRTLVAVGRRDEAIPHFRRAIECSRGKAGDSSTSRALAADARGRDRRSHAGGCSTRPKATTSRTRGAPRILAGHGLRSPRRVRRGVPLFPPSQRRPSRTTAGEAFGSTAASALRNE